MIPRFSPATTPWETARFLLDAMSPGAGDGARVARFEEAFARWQGARHVLFVPSGRMGLYLLLAAAGYPRGAEVVVPGFTYFAIPAMLRHLGLRVVYADVEPTTYEISAATVEAVITSETRAIIPTHLFGRTCPMDGLEVLARSRGLDLIEDCAQACGARSGDLRAGSRGRAAYFTFGITKNFSTYSGGVVATSDDALAADMRGLMAGFAPAGRGALIKQGITAGAMNVATWPAVFSLSLAPVLRRARVSDADPVHLRFEEAVAPITDDQIDRLRWLPGAAQAAAGLRQLATVDARNEERRRLGAALTAALEDRGVPGGPAPAAPDGDHIYVSFALRRSSRERFGGHLRRAGIDFSPGYMTACSRLPELGGTPGRCPEAEAVEREIVHLPLYPGLRDADIGRIADGVAAADRAVEAP
ncbi:MAG: DegT/DnrJ/EryC1/StrS family aminotransferase [Pseudomonadota bacterium]